MKVDAKETATTADDVTYDYYYNTQWQVLEVRKKVGAGTTTVDKQYVYHPYYVDATEPPSERPKSTMFAVAIPRSPVR